MGEANVVTIFDGRGNKIWSKQINDNSLFIDVSTFSNGVYLICIETNDGSLLMNKFAIIK